MSRAETVGLGLTALALCLLAGGCPGEDQVVSGGGLDAPTMEPGIDFRRLSVGLPSTTLDYVSDRVAALAGAVESNQVFFGSENEGLTTIYRRDLASGMRDVVAEVKELNPGTLACSADGRYLVFSRARTTARYIDDPHVTYPEETAVAYRLDTETGQTEELFDFRDEAWRSYRSDTHSPFVNRDGSQVVLLAYDIDRLTLARQCEQWLAIEADFEERGDSMEEEEASGVVQSLRQLLVAEHVASRLRDLGVEPAAEGLPSSAEREAMLTLHSLVNKPSAALLIWRDGEARSLKLSFAEGYEQSLHFILAAGSDAVLLTARERTEDPAAPHLIFSVDLESGEVAELSSYVGTPSTMELDADEENLLLVYNPTNVEAHQIMTETRLCRIPLDGGAPSEVVLPGDFLGYVDVTTDGAWLVGQDRDDYNLYLVDVAAGERQLLSNLLGDVGGVFLPDPGERLVYIEQGIIYLIEIPPDPEASADWIGVEYFADYEPRIREFLGRVGFSVPTEATFEWEEREGLGIHEVAAQVYNPARPGSAALLRYSVPDERVVALWLPLGYPFEIAAERRGTDLDFFDCKALAEAVLDSVGWLGSESRELYQPGPNPLYDGRTESFILVYRDGYWLGEGDRAEWVFNAEATLRIHDGDGTIAEMSLSDLEPVYDQQRLITLERATYNIRNLGEQPIPEDAPLRFDTENVRLVLTQRRGEGWGPVRYESRLESRLCYEIDAYIQPEEELMLTSLIDTETGEIMGQIDYLPERFMPMLGL